MLPRSTFSSNLAAASAALLPTTLAPAPSTAAAAAAAEQEQAQAHHAHQDQLHNQHGDPHNQLAINGDPHNHLAIHDHDQHQHPALHQLQNHQLQNHHPGDLDDNDPYELAWHPPPVHYPHPQHPQHHHQEQAQHGAQHGAQHDGLEQPQGFGLGLGQGQVQMHSWAVAPAVASKAGPVSTTRSVSTADELVALLSAAWRGLRHLGKLELRNAPADLARRFPLFFNELPSLVELRLTGVDTRLKEMYGPSHPSFKVGG